MVEKILVPKIDIYSLTYSDKSLEVKKEWNEDFDIDNFLHFPLLVNSDGSLWKDGNLYLLSKLKHYKKPSPKTLDSIATDLKAFKIFCVKQKIDYLSAHRKITRPTYLYRSYLQELLNTGQISTSVLKRRITTVVGFYKYLINIEGVKFKFQLWEHGISSVVYSDRFGQRQSKIVETTDITRIPQTKTQILSDDAIIDGGKLHPLTKEEQIELINALKEIGNTEMTLAFLIALVTGARIQTVFTLRLKHFYKIPNKDDKIINIKVGAGTSCDTKYMKQHILVFPFWLYNQIKIYLTSPRALKRREKAKHIFEINDQQYVFLNNRGIPFYVGSDDLYRRLYREVPNGNAVRQFISKTLIKKLKNNGLHLDFSFHDLRATFGMNLFDKLSKKSLGNDGNSLDRILIEIKERMGHSSLNTTEGYLNFRKRHKIKELSQDDYEDFIWKLVHESA